MIKNIFDLRLILDLALQVDGIILSNAKYADLAGADKWLDIINNRVIMYLFVGDIFLVPNDPLGRHGPHLHELLNVTSHISTTNHKGQR